MTISLKHDFVSAVADGSDATFVRPVDWNAEHALTMATSRVLGRSAAGSGVVEELAAASVYDVLGWEEGLAWTFQQTAAPTGWTKQTAHNDKALRLVSGTVGSGGSSPFSTVFASRTISSSHMPGHTHSFSATTGSTGPLTVNFNRTQWLYGFDEDKLGRDTDGGKSVAVNEEGQTDTMTAVMDAHTHSVSGTTGSAGSGTGWDFAIQYVDMIIATRN